MRRGERPRSGCHRVAPPWRAGQGGELGCLPGRGRSHPPPPLDGRGLSAATTTETPWSRLAPATPTPRRTPAVRSWPAPPGDRARSGGCRFAPGWPPPLPCVAVGLAAPALAQPADPTLGQVIDRLRLVLVGLLAGLATLFLTVGGVRYLFAGGDPGQVEKAKAALRAAAVGYGLAVLAPVLVRLLQYVVGA